MSTILIGIVVAAAHWLPGYALLSRVLGKEWALLPRFRKAVYSWSAGMFVLALIGAIGYLLPSPAGGITMVAVLAISAVLVISRLPKGGAEVPELLQEWVLIAGLIGLALAAVAFVAASVMPGILDLGYGDLASYARILHNFHLHRSPLVDFVIGDYVNNRYYIPLQFPLPILIASTLQTLVGDDFRVLEICAILSGMVALYAGAHLIGEKTPATRANRGVWLLLAVGVALLTFDQTVSFVLGALTLSSALLFLVAIDVWIIRDRRSLPMQTVGAVVVALLGMSRPEGIVISGVLLGCLGVRSAHQWWRVRLPSRKRTFWVLTGVGAFSTAIVFLSTFGKAGSFHYLWYLPAAGTFSLDRQGRAIPWAMVNLDIARENLGLPRLQTFPNPRVISEFIAHPKASTTWLFDTLQFNLGTSYLFTLSVLLLLLLGPLRRSALCVITAAIGIYYLVLITLINVGVSQRHLVPVTFLLLVVALRELLPWVQQNHPVEPDKAQRLGAIGLLVVGAVVGMQMAGCYLERKNSHLAFLPIFDEVKRLTSDHDLIATAYPQLASEVLDRPIVGNSFILGVLPAFVKKYSPDLIVIDDARPDILPGYSQMKKMPDVLPTMGALGYRVVADSEEHHYCIMQRERTTASSRGLNRTPAKEKSGATRQ